MKNFPVAILGAGLGSRLRTQAKAKPLAIFSGSTLLQRLQQQFLSASATQVTSALRAELLSEEDRTTLPQSEALDYLFVDTESSLHTLVALIQHLRPTQSTLFSMVDTVMRTDDLRAFVAFCGNLNPDSCALLLTPYVEDEKPLWAKVDEAGEIESFGSTPTGHVTSGMYFLSPQAMKLAEQKVTLGTEKMRNFLSALAESKIPIKSFVVEKTIDVDHPSDLKKAEGFLR